MDFECCTARNCFSFYIVLWFRSFYYTNRQYFGIVDPLKTETWAQNNLLILGLCDLKAKKV